MEKDIISKKLLICSNRNLLLETKPYFLDQKQYQIDRDNNIALKLINSSNFVYHIIVIIFYPAIFNSIQLYCTHTIFFLVFRVFGSYKITHNHSELFHHRSKREISPYFSYKSKRVYIQMIAGYPALPVRQKQYRRHGKL